MKKHIATAVAIIVVVSALFVGLESRGSTPLAKRLSEPLSLSLPTPSFDMLQFGLPIPMAEKPEVIKEAWQVFQNYMSAARDHDLPTMRTLSHQTGATCNDRAKEAECFELMDSVYHFGQNMTLDQFNEYFYDEKQIVMITDSEPLKVLLTFTRTPEGTPKVLGISWCVKEKPEDICLEKVDSDGDGWWDFVEALFYK